MLFNSWVFWVFFAVVYGLYVLVRPRRLQNLLLLFASYYFYAAWDWRFLSLIFISTLIDFFCGKRIHRAATVRRKKLFLIISICANLGMLGFFKYANFFVGSFESLMAGLGFASAVDFRLNILLPVGISFYTFQTMSYTIDIYRGKLEPTRSMLDFALFVAFFPQLVAGPIESAKHLLPQISRERNISADDLKEGAWLIFWGMWKKVVVADNMARVANAIFNSPENYSALGVYLGVVAFAFQIYGDFSGYSDIARGLARIMGIRLIVNFNLPYFAVSPSDFWTRWHISLSSWLRNNLYVSLGGNRKSTLKTYRNLMLTMVLGGLWHGASWNFVWWGVFHGLILVVFRFLRIRDELRSNRERVLRMVVMFHLTLFGWLLFRCTGYVDNAGIVHSSFDHIVKMLQAGGESLARVADGVILVDILKVSIPLMFIQILQYRGNNTLEMLRWKRLPQSILVSVLVMFWLLKGVQTGEEFIYFQF